MLFWHGANKALSLFLWSSKIRYCILMASGTKNTIAIETKCCHFSVIVVMMDINLESLTFRFHGSIEFIFTRK